MLFAIATVTSLLMACDVADNDPITLINPNCNYAGKCSQPNPFFTVCVCCAPEHLNEDNWCNDHWICDPENPSHGCIEFSGRTCSEVDRYVLADFGFRAEDSDIFSPSDITCATDPEERATQNVYRAPSIFFHQQAQYVAAQFGWPATVWPSPKCDTCSAVYPCVLGTDVQKNVTTGTTYAFRTNLNEFYDMSCGIAGIVLDVSQLPECEENYDYGQLAHATWLEVRGDIENDDVKFINAMNDLLWAEPNESNQNLGLNWTNTLLLGMGEEITKSEVKDVYITLTPTLYPTESPTSHPTNYPTEFPTNYPTEFPTNYPTGFPTNRPSAPPTLTPTETPTNTPTGHPTELPTNLPSATPTLNPTERPTNDPTSYPTDDPTLMPTVPTVECGPYTNNVEDLEFQGVGSDCRAGLNMSWPGGLSCDSPYILCLPQENTPATFNGNPYKSSTYRYSVDECLQECSNDQRCMGIEFVADSNSVLGDCNLIDDIPPEITAEVNGFLYEPLHTYGNLDSEITGGDALCFEKKDTCYPYFEADDLNEVMLNCYCPNNRKGSYTKKVKRTVTNTRFCGSDSEADLRIQKAQANRMFHLCENWCLFNTDDPEGESWYWDPWQTCWREQYGGVGMHMSYCNRVIRSPDTIEMQFINHRTNMFCQS